MSWSCKMRIAYGLHLTIVFWSIAATALVAEATTSPSPSPTTSGRPASHRPTVRQQILAASLVLSPGVMSAKYWPTAHGFLMWSSFGVLMPLGIIIIRFSKHFRTDGAKLSGWMDALRYAHIIAQILGVVLGTVGGGIALDKFGLNFRFTHQRLGLALLVLMWLQCFVGLIRPRFGSGPRPFWYGLHWILGTGAVILGFVNIFIGMHVYELIFRTSIRTFNVLFSVQLAFFSLVYLLQDRFGYLLLQGQSVKPVAPATFNGSGISVRAIP